MCGFRWFAVETSTPYGELGTTQEVPGIKVTVETLVILSVYVALKRSAIICRATEEKAASWSEVNWASVLPGGECKGVENARGLCRSD